MDSFLLGSSSPFSPPIIFYSSVIKRRMPHVVHGKICFLEVDTCFSARLLIFLEERSKFSLFNNILNYFIEFVTD